jgi:hypothetical protein
MCTRETDDNTESQKKHFIKAFRALIILSFVISLCSTLPFGIIYEFLLPAIGILPLFFGFILCLHQLGLLYTPLKWEYQIVLGSDDDGDNNNDGDNGKKRKIIKQLLVAAADAVVAGSLLTVCIFTVWELKRFARYGYGAGESAFNGTYATIPLWCGL